MRQIVRCAALAAVMICVAAVAQAASRHRKPGVPVPFRPFRFQFVVQGSRAFLGGPSHSKFHGHDRNAQDDQEKQINQNENCPAVLPGHIRKFPHVPDADGAACRKQDKPQPGTEFFAFHIQIPFLSAGVSCTV